MISKEHVVNSMKHEVKVIKHIAGKLPAGSLGYKPTPKQRTMLELLQYLTTCAIVPVTFAVSGSWDEAEKIEEAAKAVNADNFAKAMDAQMSRIEKILDGVSSHDFVNKDAQMPWGTKCKLGEGIMNMALKCLVTYRMQLFLYAKAAGNHDLGPADCWAGMTMPKQPAAANNN